MTIKTQIRRTLLSLVALAGFGSVALVQGDPLAPPSAEALLAAECEERADDPAVMVRVVEPVRVDWRVRVPATIARSRS